EYFEHVHRINRNLGSSRGILADLQGPKIRIGNVANGGVMLETGNTVIITDKEAESSAEKLFVSYHRLAKDVRLDEKILIDDGKIVLQVEKILNEHEFEAKVLHGGLLTSKKGVNLPQSKLTIP